MEKFERLDFESPKKEFIKNNLLFMLGDDFQDQKNIAQISYDQDIKYSHNRYLRLFYRVLLKNDTAKIEQFNKRMISILDRSPKLKKYVKARLIGKPKSTNHTVSLQHLLPLSINNFITQLYITMLGRLPDGEGFNSWQSMICSSMPKEAVIYAISKTAEFGNRFQIENTKKYKNAYRKYRIKHVLKKTPVLGYIAGILMMPRRVEQLMTSQNINFENMVSFHESTIHRINEIQAFNHHFLCEFISKTDENGRSLDSAIKRMNKTLNESSLKMDEINKNVNSRIQELQDEMQGIDKEILELQGSMQGINDEILVLQSKIPGINNVIQGLQDSFDNRFTSIGHAVDSGIKDISAYTKDLNFDIRVIGENLQHGSANTMAELDRLFKKVMKPYYLNMYAASYEMEHLKQSNITLIEGLVDNSRGHVQSGITVVGHYAQEIFEDVRTASNIRFLKPVTLETMICSKLADKENRLVVPEAIPHSIDRQDKVIILNPAVAAMLVMENKLQELAMKIKNELILVLGSNDGENLSVAWGEGFSGIERSENGDFYRWYQGALPTGTIQILNNSGYRQECTIKFSIFALDAQSQIIIRIGTTSNIYNMKNGFVEIIEHALLSPGVNAITIEFFGKSLQLAADPRYLKFAVKGFSAVWKTDNNVQISIDGAEAYKRQTLLEETMSMPTDDLVRSSLHLNGFFEVEKFICSNNQDSLVSGGLSRFCEANLAYRFIKPNVANQYSGLNIYVAKRKGEYIDDV